MNITKWEKIASKILTSLIGNPTDNFDKIEVDVIPTSYNSYEVSVSVLFKKPFTKYDSDFYYDQKAKITNYIMDFLPPLGKNYSISQGASTVDFYEQKNKPYLETKKRVKIDETVLKTLKKLNGDLLTEASKKQILTDKIGLTEKNAEELERVAGTLSVLMAKKLFDYQFKALKSWRPDLEPTKEDTLERLNNNFSVLLRKVTEIMDWVRVGLNGNLGENKNLSLDELLNKSKQWHDSLGIGESKVNYTENNPILIDFRNKDGEGFYWVDLETNSSNEECERMGHCGRTGYGNTLYSLREFKKIPGSTYTINRSHLTASISNDGILYQLKGPKNSKPKEEFHSYILPLFYVLGLPGEEEDYLIQGFGTEYASERDFKLTDLPDSVIKDLYTNRPELFNTRSLQRKLSELGVIELPQIDYNIVLKITPDHVGDYVDGDWVISRRKVKKTTPAGQQYETVVQKWLFETILYGDTFELWDNYDADWKSSLNYDVNDENEKRIREILKHLAQKNDPEFNEEEFNETTTEDLINEYDEEYEIARAISNSRNGAESDDYSNHLYTTLKDCLEEYGTIEKMDDTGVILHINLKPFIDNLDESDYDDFMERCNDDVSCVFEEMLNEGYIDKPKFDIDDRWYPDVDESYFNDLLSDYLSDAERVYLK